MVCSHDGLASASLATVSRLLAQVRAIDKLQLRKRDMVKLLMSNVTCDDGSNLKVYSDRPKVHFQGSAKTETLVETVP